MDLTAGEWEALDALRPDDATARARLGDPAFRRLVAQAAEKLRLASVQGDAEPVTGFQVPRLSPCPFCEYLAGRVDADDPPVVITEDAMTVAYVAANPLGGMPGQVLVVTRRHAETILDLRPEEEAALAATVGDAARAVRAALPRACWSSSTTGWRPSRPSGTCTSTWCPRSRGRSRRRNRSRACRWRSGCGWPSPCAGTGRRGRPRPADPLVRAR